MKKVNILLLSTLIFLGIYSCTSFEDVKEISGTLIFNEIGTHSFSINAENIEATITMVGPNNGETFVFENVKLSRTDGIEKVVRDLRVHRILEGTNEIMRLIVARDLLKNR